MSSSWCTRSFKFVHRLGEPTADQLRKHLEQGISERHTQPCCAAILRWHLWLQWRSHALACANYAIFVVHRYMVCVCDLPPCGAWCPMPLQNGSKNFFANERPLMSSSRHRRQRNCVNCKCCVVDVPGVSHSCIEYESQLQTSWADTLNRVYRKGTSNPVTQLFWDGTFDCSGEAMPWYAQTMQYL